MCLLITLLTLLLTLAYTLAMPQSTTKTRLSPSTPNRNVQDATCTTGPPAQTGELRMEPGMWPIVNYTLVQPEFAVNGAPVAYEVDGEWVTRHVVSGPHVRFPFSCV